MPMVSIKIAGSTVKSQYKYACFLLHYQVLLCHFVAQ